MNYPLYITYIATVFFLIATPGAVVGYIFHISHRDGWRKAVIAAIGTNAASLCLIAFATLIIFGTLVINQTVFDLVSLVGSFFLVIMAIKMFREIQNGTVNPDIGIKKNTTAVFLNAFLIGISNPKDIIFFVAFFPQFMKIMPTTEKSLTVLILTWIMCDFLILCAYIFIARHKLTVKRMRVVSFVSAAVIFAVGIGGVIYNTKNLMI
ncbi:LysE family translocator [Neisseria dumasiana]|uniref:Lysine transporter LysE n=1 Tax=Neisseria dumasiana TaxID=1931275 RepID=A0A1X3D4S7_9NEIS|nr:LysE family translocator [Neisseria dumasiana]OSI14920.1 hypothetical protein BV912_12255 [Neisseria dumasiana]